jgi:hypothetical protein
MQTLALVGFERYFQCEAPLAFGTGVSVDRGEAGFEQHFVALRGIAVRAEAVLGGFLVLDKRRHGGGGGEGGEEMRY